MYQTLVVRGETSVDSTLPTLIPPPIANLRNDQSSPDSA